MSLEPNRVEISLRLLQNGKYTWNISINYPSEKAQDAIEVLQTMDKKIKHMFPHPEPNSVRTFSSTQREEDETNISF